MCIFDCRQKLNILALTLSIDSTDEDLNQTSKRTTRYTTTNEFDKMVTVNLKRRGVYTQAHTVASTQP